MDPPNRITKDTSARKNTPSAIHSAIELAAIKASNDAYNNSMIQGYQNKIAAIEAEQQALIDEAVQSANARSSDQIRNLEETIGELKRVAVEAKMETNKVKEEMQQKAATLERIIKRLNQKLEVGPNSWVEFHVTGKSRKKRTYVKRPTAPFTEAMTDFAKDLGKTIEYMRFEVAETEVLGKDRRTLQQLNVKDGATIEFLS
ncbi:hypothetical protein PRZ48_005618 [Zasmidium cellare]|uniref:Rad60/SUMO-like domain-containing protein n=1 Tax=Zasmidium cellare TaxID=395010 RepID=A0ABR0EN05_ZASCE|nr:hypothetical protein PRZ48_005618 [Zasmidium cellare]